MGTTVLLLTDYEPLLNPYYAGDIVLWGDVIGGCVVASLVSGCAVTSLVGSSAVISPSRLLTRRLRRNFLVAASKETHKRRVLLFEAAYYYF
ncbi:hypothetical protein PC118_g24678 [Phytophthora cactorum]|uniref:Uncharacterized protein n=1 Tax=Phytophthora cactorum TaxID=29920 RepID=A0A8T1ERG1_9STRA|nr:hypothetical protein PC118_g24678 [Phytophthora cactorum]